MTACRVATSQPLPPSTSNDNHNGAQRNSTVCARMSPKWLIKRSLCDSGIGNIDENPWSQNHDWLQSHKTWISAHRNPGQLGIDVGQTCVLWCCVLVGVDCAYFGTSRQTKRWSANIQSVCVQWNFAALLVQPKLQRAAKSNDMNCQKSKLLEKDLRSFGSGSIYAMPPAAPNYEVYNAQCTAVFPYIVGRVSVCVCSRIRDTFIHSFSST